MSEPDKLTDPMGITGKSALYRAEWWAGQAVDWWRFGNAERAGHAAATAYHFTRLAEKGE